MEKMQQERGRPKRHSKEERLLLGEQLQWYYECQDPSMTAASKRLGISEGLAWKLYDEFLEKRRAARIAQLSNKGGSL